MKLQNIWNSLFQDFLRNTGFNNFCKLVTYAQMVRNKKRNPICTKPRLKMTAPYRCRMHKVRVHPSERQQHSRARMNNVHRSSVIQSFLRVIRFACSMSELGWTKSTSVSLWECAVMGVDFYEEIFECPSNEIFIVKNLRLSFWRNWQTEESWLKSWLKSW